jgi:hypothetical protein
MTLERKTVDNHGAESVESVKLNATQQQIMKPVVSLAVREIAFLLRLPSAALRASCALAAKEIIGYE